MAHLRKLSDSAQDAVTLAFFYKDARHQTCTEMLSLCVSLKAGAHYLEALNEYTGLAKVGYGFTDLKIIRS